MTTPFLELDELEPSQSQPEIIINPDLRRLEAAISIDVLDKDLTTPPASPAATARYIIPAAATGAWAGHETEIAYLQETVWKFLEPREGWLVYVLDEGERYEWDGAAWALAAFGGSITITGPDDSPPTSVVGVTSIEFVNATVDDLGGGAARVTTMGGGGGGSAEEGHGTLTTVGISSNTINIDHALGADFDLELTANVTTVNHNNVTNGDANWFTLRIRQDGVGGRTFAPPASWIYPSGVSAYSPSSGAGDIDLVQGVSYTNGTTWLISYDKDYV